MSPRSIRSTSPSSYSSCKARAYPNPPTKQLTPFQPLLHINFEKCCQSPRLLPAASIAYASRSVLTDPFAYADALLYGPDRGSTALRAAIAGWLTDFYDSADEMRMEEICITGGASQNLAAILQKFTDPVYTRAAWLVAPSSPHRCRIFEDNGLEGKIRFVPEDPDGIDIETLEQRMSQEEARATAVVNVRPVFKSAKNYPKIYRHIIYCMPTFKNPTSATMSLLRRQQLVALARRYDALIVADDAFDFLRWGPSAASERPLPRLVDIDSRLPYRNEYGNAVSNASFSVLIAPGCRVGWLQGTELFVKTLSEVGTTQAGGAPSQLVSTFIWNLLTTGTLQSFLADILIPAYSRRHAALIVAIASHLRPLGVSMREQRKEATGGWFLWLRLPDWCDGRVLVGRLKDEWRLTVAHGGMFEGGGGEGFLRICLAWEEEGRLEEGVRRIAEAMERMRRGNHIDVKDLLV